MAGPLRIRGHGRRDLVHVLPPLPPSCGRPRRQPPGAGRPSAHAAPTPFPADFRSSQVVNADATINVRVDGHGPAVVLTHGFGETGDMWSPMAAELAKDHTVVVPDLRGMGLSSHPPAATTSGRPGRRHPRRPRQARHRPRRHRGPRHRHDGRVCLRGALSGQDKPPGRDRLAGARHPAVETDRAPARIVALQLRRPGRRAPGRRPRAHLPRPLLDEFAGDPSKIDEATRRHYAAIYARPGAMHSAFAQFLAIGQKDEADNLKAMETKLAMPVLAIGAAKAFGANVAVGMRNAATNAQEVVVPSACHWLMEEAPAATIAAARDFIAAYRASVHVGTGLENMSSAASPMARLPAWWGVVVRWRP